MTKEQIHIIQNLQKVRFLPYSWDKRFVRDISSKDLSSDITPSQNEWMYRLLYKYRKQIPKTYARYQNHPSCSKAPAPIRINPHSPDAIGPPHPVDPCSREGKQLNLDIT